MFKIVAENTLMHKDINIRTERHGEDDVGAVDVYFKCHSDAATANFLMGGFAEEEPPNLWDDTENKDIRYHGIAGTINSSASFDDCSVKFKNVVMKGVKVNAFKFSPIPGGKIELTLRVQFRPSDDQLTKLYHFQKKGGKLTITIDEDFSRDDGEAQTDLEDFE